MAPLRTATLAIVLILPAACSENAEVKAMNGMADSICNCKQGDCVATLKPLVDVYRDDPEETAYKDLHGSDRKAYLAAARRAQACARAGPWK